MAVATQFSSSMFARARLVIAACPRGGGGGGGRRRRVEDVRMSRWVLMLGAPLVPNTLGPVCGGGAGA